MTKYYVTDQRGSDVDIDLILPELAKRLKPHLVQGDAAGHGAGRPVPRLWLEGYNYWAADEVGIANFYVSKPAKMAASWKEVHGENSRYYGVVANYPFAQWENSLMSRDEYDRIMAERQAADANRLAAELKSTAQQVADLTEVREILVKESSDLLKRNLGLQQQVERQAADADCLRAALDAAENERDTYRTVAEAANANAERHRREAERAKAAHAALESDFNEAAAAGAALEKRIEHLTATERDLHKLITEKDRQISALNELLVNERKSVEYQRERATLWINNYGTLAAEARHFRADMMAKASKAKDLEFRWNSIPWPQLASVAQRAWPREETDIVRKWVNDNKPKEGGDAKLD